MQPSNESIAAGLFYFLILRLRYDAFSRLVDRHCVGRQVDRVNAPDTGRQLQRQGRTLQGSALKCETPTEITNIQQRVAQAHTRCCHKAKTGNIASARHHDLVGYFSHQRSVFFQLRSSGLCCGPPSNAVRVGLTRPEVESISDQIRVHVFHLFFPLISVSVRRSQPQYTTGVSSTTA